MSAVGFSFGQRTLEWSGAITGLLGSALLAANLSISGFGFLVYLASNAFWIGFAVSTRAWGLLAMQAGFTATSLLGIARWLG